MASLFKKRTTIAHVQSGPTQPGSAHPPAAPGHPGRATYPPSSSPSTAEMEGAARKLTALARGSSARKLTRALSEGLSNQIAIAADLLASEREYIHELATIGETYEVALRAVGPSRGASVEALDCVLGPIPGLLDFHRSLAATLDGYVSSGGRLTSSSEQQQQQPAAAAAAAAAEQPSPSSPPSSPSTRADPAAQARRRRAAGAGLAASRSGRTSRSGRRRAAAAMAAMATRRAAATGRSGSVGRRAAAGAAPAARTATDARALCPIRPPVGVAAEHTLRTMEANQKLAGYVGAYGEGQGSDQSMKSRGRAPRFGGLARD